MESFRNAEDEIDTFENMMNIGIEEAFWKVNEFHMHHIYSAFKLIDVNLQRKQKVYFDNEDEIVEIINEVKKEKKLTEV